MMKSRSFSIAKIGQGTVNEDAVKALNHVIAVSDGAGGGGVYAERWSEYLLAHLPEKPILSFNELDEWIGEIWEEFYNDCEALAKQEGGMLMDKFYDEGSFATLVAVWRISEKEYQWISYGDSVAFHYNWETDVLSHSFTSLSDFNKPPYLINCKDELSPSGFRNGTFYTDRHSVVFCTSDTLAHYILMMYELSHCGNYSDELQQAERFRTKDAQFIQIASAGKIDFGKVLTKLLNCRSTSNFTKHMESLLRKRLIAIDDYSMVVFGKSKCF